MSKLINVKCQCDATPSAGWPTRIAEVISNGSNQCVVAVSAGIASLETHQFAMPAHPVSGDMSHFGCVFPVATDPVFDDVASGPNDPLFPVNQSPLVSEMVQHLTNPDRREGEANMALLVAQEKPDQTLIDEAVRRAK